jgi:hypothetical protein
MDKFAMIICRPFANYLNSRKGKPIARWGRKVKHLRYADRPAAEGLPSACLFFYQVGKKEVHSAFMKNDFEQVVN